MGRFGMRWLALTVQSLLFFCTANAAPLDGRIEEARRLHQQGLDLYQRASYEEGFPIATRAVEMRQELLGREHADTAASLISLGLYHRAKGDYAQADRLLLQGLAIREKVLGPDHLDTAAALNNLGALYYSSGDFAKAEAMFQRALTIREKALGEEHIDTAASFGNLGALYSAIGAYAKAATFNQRALQLREMILGPEHLHVALSLSALANVYQRQGDYPKAQPLYQRAIAIVRKVRGPQHPETAALIGNLATLFYFTGDYPQAEVLFEEELAIEVKALGAEHPIAASTMGNLGELYLTTGAYSKAEALLERANAICEQSLGEKHVDTGVSLATLGHFHEQIGNHAKARSLLERAIVLYEKAVGPEHADLAEALNYLAAVQLATGNYGTAEQLLQRSLAINEKALGAQNTYVAATLAQLGAVYFAMGDLANAQSLQQRALAVREKVFGEAHPDTARSLTDLAIVNWARGEPLKALPLLQRAQAIQTRTSERFLLSGSEPRKQAYLRGLANDVYTNASFAVLQADRESIALGLTSVLQYKGKALDAVSDSVARLRQSLKTEDRALFEQLALLAKQFSALTYQGAGGLAPEALRARLDDLSRQQDRLETELSRRSREFRRQETPQLRNVLAALPPDSALIEWLRYRPFDPRVKDLKSQWGAPRYLAYILKASGELSAVDIGRADEVETLIRDLRLAVNDPLRSDVRQVAATVSRQLIKPLLPHMKGTAHLLISPDGALNLLPMAALLDDRGQYLLESYQITYLTSGRDLLRLDTAETPARRHAVIIAAPQYGNASSTPAAMASSAQRSAELDRSGIRFRSLPGTALEAAAIRRLLGDDTSVFTQADASEAKLKQLQSPNILHLATHGFFLKNAAADGTPPDGKSLAAENPLLRSGLALAGANQRGSGSAEDGILTALEASRLNLQGTELVVLSACETGVGEVQNGDGVGGLRRGLFMAGARTQILSLWKVADLPTKELMVNLYKKLVSGYGRSAALREAQREMAATPAQSHPYYWANFVAIGDWRPIAASEAR